MSKITLFRIPDIAIKEIFSYLSFDEVARLRVVNQDFNTIGKEVLNKGLIKVERFHNLSLKEVRVQLPRRESERRTHPLARHVDVLMAIETRISMLSMTYSKYIDSGLACFIPGKVLDEIYRVLRLVRGSEFPPRPHEILQELRDISSMAMEHFDDKIAPELKQKLSPGNSSGLLFVKEGSLRRRSYTLQHSHQSVSISPQVAIPRTRRSTRDESQQIGAIELGMRKAKVSAAAMRLEIKELKNKVRRQNRLIIDQRKKISENTSKISEQSTQLAELRRLIDEYGQKMSSQSHGSSDKSLPSTSYANSQALDLKRKVLNDGRKCPPEKRKKNH